MSISKSTSIPTWATGSSQLRREPQDSRDTDVGNIVLQEKNGASSTATKTGRRRMLCFKG